MTFNFLSTFYYYRSTGFYLFQQSRALFFVHKHKPKVCKTNCNVGYHYIWFNMCSEICAKCHSHTEALSFLIYTRRNVSCIGTRIFLIFPHLKREIIGWQKTLLSYTDVPCSMNKKLYKDISRNALPDYIGLGSDEKCQHKMKLTKYDQKLASLNHTSMPNGTKYLEKEQDCGSRWLKIQSSHPL